MITKLMSSSDLMKEFPSKRFDGVEDSYYENNKCTIKIPEGMELDFVDANTLLKYYN